MARAIAGRRCPASLIVGSHAGMQSVCASQTPRKGGLNRDGDYGSASPLQVLVMLTNTKTFVAGSVGPRRYILTLPRVVASGEGQLALHPRHGREQDIIRLQAYGARAPTHRAHVGHGGALRPTAHAHNGPGSPQAVQRSRARIQLFRGADREEYTGEDTCGVVQPRAWTVEEPVERGERWGRQREQGRWEQQVRARGGERDEAEGLAVQACGLYEEAREGVGSSSTSRTATARTSDCDGE